jgi:hypothetical protein
VYSSDALPEAGCRLLFRARRGTAIEYQGGVLVPARQPGPARELLRFLASREAAPRYRQCGFRPITARA